MNCVDTLWTRDSAVGKLCSCSSVFIIIIASLSLLLSLSLSLSLYLFSSLVLIVVVMGFFRESFIFNHNYTINDGERV